jgi:hypothetical protein
VKDHVVRLAVAQGKLVVVLFKMARWDPDKNWEGALKNTRGLKEQGLKTVLVARSGVESNGQVE